MTVPRRVTNGMNARESTTLWTKLGDLSLAERVEGTEC